MSTTATLIRRNPPVAATPRGTGETCPEHGHYHPDTEVGSLIRRATSPGVRPTIGRALLDRAARLRRHCPECNGPRPTPLEWAAARRQTAINN